MIEVVHEIKMFISYLLVYLKPQNSTASSLLLISYESNFYHIDIDTNK